MGVVRTLNLPVVKLRGLRAQMRGGVAFAVPLLAVALRTVLEIELLARLPLRLGPDVGSRRAHRSRRRGTQRGDQDARHRDSATRATDQARGHCVRGLLLGARPPAGEIVEKEDRVPHLVFLQELLPGGHGRVPGPAFLGKPGASLGDPPEQKRLAKHRDRPRVGEVGRDRVQPVHEHAVAGHVVAVAEDAVPVVDLAPVLDVLAELCRIRRLEMPERVLSGVEIDLLVVNRDLRRRCRMDRSREERRLEGDVHLDVDVRGRERRDGDDRRAEERRVPLLRHEPDERAGDFFAALLAGGHVRQDRDRDDSHVDRDDGGGNRGRESESEEDVDPHPPGAGPHQQVGPTEAKEPEHGEHGEDDQDLHCCVPFGGEAAPPGAGGAGGRRPGRRGRAAVVVVFRLQRDGRRAAKRLEVRDHAEDLLIGEADRRLVDGRHRRGESRRR